MDLADFPIVAVAISIVICWALLAILCSFVHEAIVQVKAERGRFMRKYLFNQLRDFSNDINWGSMVYMHGTIELLSRDSGEPPPNINPRLFAETLIEVVGNARKVQVSEEEGRNPYERSQLNNFKKATQVLIRSDIMGFLTQALKSAEQSVETVQGEDRENKIYNKLVENIEAWYKEMMDRMGDWYKKKTKGRIFWLGVILGFLLNIDSIQLFNHFNANPESRKIVMEFYQKNADALQSRIDTLQLTTQQDSAALAAVTRQLRSYSQDLDSLGKKAELPVGFKKSIFRNFPPRPWGWIVVLKILGVLITGLAASFGAPFWFDVLRKAYTRKA